MKRYPLQNLIDAAGITGANELSTAELGRRLGMPYNTLQRARRRGLVESAADRWACRLGFVPWLVWPEWIDDVIADCEVVCADEFCGGRFVPKRGNQKYCDPRCAHRVAKRNYARRKYQTDPEVRARKLAAVAAYRESSKRARLVYQRAYYRENAPVLLAKKAAYREANRELLRERQRAYRQRKREQKAA